MSESADPELQEDDRGAVVVLTLNRPEVGNALTLSLIETLAARITASAADPRCRALVLQGAGERSFCTGFDLARAGKEGGDHLRALNAAFAHLMDVVASSPTPIIAALNGGAVAGGAGLALAAHLRIGTTRAYFQFVETRRGLAPDYASLVLPTLISPAAALFFLTTARRLTAARAEALGLLEGCDEFGDDLDAAVSAVVADLVAGAPLSIQRTVRLASSATGSSSGPLAVLKAPDVLGSEDRLEGMAAFRERRPPVWRGR